MERDRCEGEKLLVVTGCYCDKLGVPAYLCFSFTSRILSAIVYLLKPSDPKPMGTPFLCAL